MALDAYALFTAVHLISGLISGCEFRTYRNGKEQRSAEWYSLNVRPNRNQNAAEWKRELVSRLLLYGEVLVVQTFDDQLIIAEGFNRTEYAVIGDVFEQVSRAGYTFPRSYRADDVIFLQSPVNARNAWLQQTMTVYERLMQSAADRFQKAGGERGILNISSVAAGSSDFEAKFNKLMNQYFKSYFSGKNAVLPLFDGYNYSSQASGSSSGTYTNDLSAVKTLADEAISRAAQLFGIPPSYIRGDAAGISESQKAALTNCIDPLAAMISAEFTAKKHTRDEVTDGSCIAVDTGSILHHDLIADAGNADKLIGSGWSLNEVRRQFGQTALPDTWADSHFITKNYQVMNIAAEGGEQT